MTDEVFSAEWAGELHHTEVEGHRMASSRLGEGDPVVFLHGNPASSYLWRNVLPVVARTHRVISVDMIGMGRSDKPDLDYTFATHRRFVEGFLDAEGLDRCAVVAHDWGTAVMTAIVADREGLARGLCLCDPFWVRAEVPPEAAEAALASMSDQDQAGNARMMELLMDMIGSDEGNRRAREQDTFHDPILQILTARRLRPEEVDGYRRCYPTPDSRRAVYQWPRNVPFDGENPADVVATFDACTRWLTETDTPILLPYVDRGLVRPVQVPWFEANVADLTAVHLGDGKHYFQEDHPVALGEAIGAWLGRLPG